MALPQSALSELLEAFRAGDGVDLIRESVRVALQELIEAEATERIGAARYERTPDRVTDRNGNRPRVLSTKAGDVELRIPKLRKGSFFPVILEPCPRRTTVQVEQQVLPVNEDLDVGPLVGTVGDVLLRHGACVPAPRTVSTGILEDGRRRPWARPALANQIRPPGPDSAGTRPGRVENHPRWVIPAAREAAAPPGPRGKGWLGRH
jgi:hypothetical protein